MHLLQKHVILHIIILSYLYIYISSTSTAQHTIHNRIYKYDNIVHTDFEWHIAETSGSTGGNLLLNSKKQLRKPCKQDASGEDAGPCCNACSAWHPVSKSTPWQFDSAPLSTRFTKGHDHGGFTVIPSLLWNRFLWISKEHLDLPWCT